MPMSNRIRFERIAERMRMNAPKVPISVGTGMKERQGRVHVIVAGGQVMTHFVSHQNRQQGQGKRKPVQKIGGIVPDSQRNPSSSVSKSKGRPSAKLCGEARAHYGRGQQRQQQQQRMQPIAMSRANAFPSQRLQTRRRNG